MNAVFSALNCLADIEVIRDELRNGLLKRGGDSIFNEASTTTFFSVLRMGIDFYVSRFSNLTNVMIQDHEMQWERSTDRLIAFLKKMPDEKSFAKIRMNQFFAMFDDVVPDEIDTEQGNDLINLVLDTLETIE